MVGSTLLAGLIVIVIAVIAGSWPFRAIGTTDPGAVVRIVTPFLRLVVDVAATVCVGSLVFAAYFTRPQASGVVSPAAYAALQRAGKAAIVWLIAALLIWPFDAAATAGLPPSRVLSPHAMRVLTGALEGPKAWLVTIGLVGLVAIGCRRAIRWQTTLLLSALAVFAVLPPLATGHSASDAGHDLATAAIMIHVPAAVIWLGVLIALTAARRTDGSVDRRYRRMSRALWWLLVYSGLIDAAVLAPGHTPWTTGYGLVLGLKVLIALGLGAMIMRMRDRISLRSRAAWLAGEMVLLAAAYGLAVGLATLPAPKFVGMPVTGDETLIGYNIGGPPTWARLAFDWRIEVLFAPLCVLLAWAYWVGMRRMRRAGGAWPAARAISWYAGCLVLLLATSSGLGRYAPTMFSVQAATHMLVGMVAPILMALGAPLTLAAATVRPASPGDLPGPAEWIEAVRDSRAIRILTQPLLCTAIFVAAPFLLYFTPAYDVTVRFHWAHLGMDLLFLVIGYLFAWMIIGSDPLPHPVPNLMRIGLLLAVMPADILFAAAIVASRRIIGDSRASANMYSALELPWVGSLHADQRLGAYLALAISEAAVLVTLAVAVARWRPAERDADLGDYRPLVEALRARSAAPTQTPAGRPAERSDAGSAVRPDGPQP